MNDRLVLRALTALAAAALTGCTTATLPATPGTPAPSVTDSPSAAQTASSAPAPPPLRQVHDPGQVTGTITGPCLLRDGGQLPDPRCTPGAYDPAITAAVLCAPGYTTASYRPPSSQTTAFKLHVADVAYGMPGAVGELDHEVPLTLGGANDASNLWVEAGPIPNPKDTIEVKLHAWVCAGGPGVAQGRLEAAQVAIAADWLTAEQALGIK